MSTWRVAAPGKINLCLYLGGTRADGRHELVTLFESVSLADELVVSESDRDEVICPGVDGRNLVADAIDGLRAAGWQGPRLRVEITKRVPTAAGMGGGSADAAALLRLAPRIAPVADAVVGALAAQLGADVPSQLRPGVALGTGAGDVVRQRPALPEHAVLIVPPEHALPTAEVYHEADSLGLGRGEEQLDRLADELLTPEGVLARAGENDLQPAALSLCPSIEAALDAVRGSGAHEAFVCGSGPTVAGLFWGPAGGELAAAASSSLQSRYPGVVVAEPVRAGYGIPRIA